MPVLSNLDQQRARSHLGYTLPAGVPAFAEVRIQEAFQNIYSNHDYHGKGGIQYWLDRCDAALDASDPVGSDAFLRKQLITGDINRATIDVRSLDIDFWWELYLKQTDQLAFKLNVPNFRRPENAAYIWQNWSTSYIQGIPGPPDTCISDRLWLNLNFA